MSIFLTSTTLAVLVQLKSASVGTKNPIHCVDKQPHWSLLLSIIFKWEITMLISNTTHKIPQIYWTFSPTPYWWVFAKKLINKSLIDRFLSPCSWGVNAIFARKMALPALCSRHETCFNGFWCSFTINLNENATPLITHHNATLITEYLPILSLTPKISINAMCLTKLN